MQTISQDIVQAVGLFCDIDTRRALRLPPRKLSDHVRIEADTLLFPAADVTEQGVVYTQGLCGKMIRNSESIKSRHCTMLWWLPHGFMRVGKSVALSSNSVKPPYITYYHCDFWYEIYNTRLVAECHRMTVDCKELVCTYRDSHAPIEFFLPGTALLAAFPDSSIKCVEH